MDFTVSLERAQAGTVTVDYATANGSAVAPGDYTAATGTVTFAPGDTSETVTVRPTTTPWLSPTETFDVNLSGATGNAVIADGLGVGTIVDNDVEPQRQISINDVSVAEGKRADPRSSRSRSTRPRRTRSRSTTRPRTTRPWRPGTTRRPPAR